MNKKILHYIKDILAAVILCSVFLSHSYAEIATEEYSDQKEIILEKAQDDNKTI